MYNFQSTEGRKIIEEYSSVRRHVEVCVINFGGHWDKFLLLCEFYYKSSHPSSIDMTPFEEVMREDVDHP